MSFNSLSPAAGSTHKRKRVGRGQGSGMGKTATKGHKGHRARSGYKIKRGFEGGQQPLQRRVPKVGFISKVIKPYVINVDKISKIKELGEITIESIRGVHKFSNKIEKIKLIGAGTKEIKDKIKDENITVSGQS